MGIFVRSTVNLYWNDMRNPSWCPLWIIVGLSMLLLLIGCVYLTVQMHIRAYILLSHNVGHWTTELSLQREESCAHQCGFSNLLLLISHNPPALTCQSKTDGLTSDIWSLNRILIGSLAARGLLIHCLSLKHTQTHLLPVCVWFCDRSLEGFFWLFIFVFLIFLLFFVLHGRSELLWQSLPEKILRKSP